MISANFFNFDPAGNNLPTETSENNQSNKDFASVFDQMFVYPTNASVSFQNSAPAESEVPPELLPICIKTNGGNFTVKENANQRLLPNPSETVGETTIETPPIIEMPQILKPTGKQTPLDAPPNPKAGIIAKETKNTTVETPPILPEQTTYPVETPPIFEQQNDEKPVLPPNDTQKPVETPPIIILPSTTVSQTKPATLKPNTKRIEQNTEETPPIVVLPENGGAKTEKDAPMTKAEYVNSTVKIKNNGAVKKAETNISKPEINTAKNEANTAKSEIHTAKIEVSTAKSEINNAKVEVNTAKIEVNNAKVENNNARLEVGNAKTESQISKAENNIQRPLAFVNTDKSAGIRQKDWNTSRETENQPETSEVNMVQQVLNLSKMNGKIVRRESSQTINATVTNADEKDYTPILIPNENVSFDYSVKTENRASNDEKSSKLENILFNISAPKATETPENKGFGKISIEEFQLNETPKNSPAAKNETAFSGSLKTDSTAEVLLEANAELFTKSVFPKRKAFASAYEAAGIIRGEESLNAKFDLPQVEKTPNVFDKIEITEQVEMQMTGLAAKVEQTKETQILKMRLNPAELGTVEIHLEKNANGQLQAHLSTESETARAALHENIDQLRNTLEKAGWQVGAVEVTASTTSTEQFGGSRQNGENQPNNFYQSFSKAENAEIISQTEMSDRDDLQHIVSLRA